MHFFLFPRSARQSHNSLEERTRDIEALKMEMDQLQDKFSGLNKSFLRSVKQTLQESDIPGEDKEVGTRKLIVTVFAPHSFLLYTSGLITSLSLFYRLQS